MKKRLKILWTIVAATMFLMMPANLQAQWPNGGIKVSIVSGYGQLRVVSKYGPGGLFGKEEERFSSGEWTLDHPAVTEDWNFEVGYWPGYNDRLWKVEMRDLKSGKLILTYYPEDLKDKGDGRYEYEVKNARSLDGKWFQWYTMKGTHQWVEVYSYFQENYGPSVRRDEAGSAHAQNGKEAVSGAENGSILTLVANPNPGYAFKRWSVLKGYSALRDDELLLVGDTRVAAIFMPVTQAVVTFDPQGGTLESTTASPNAEGKFTSLPTPVRGDFGFRGWYDEDGNPFTTESVVKRNMTVYARWNQGLYVETNEIDFGRVLEGYTTIPSKRIHVQNLYGTPVKHSTEGAPNFGASMKGQPLDPNEESDIWVSPLLNRAPGIYNETKYVVNDKDSNKHPVNLKFKVEPVYTIKFELAGGVGAEGFAATTTTNLNFRAEVWPADPTRPGHEFLGWYDLPSYDGDWNPLGNKYDNKSWFDSSRTLYAKWRKVVYLDKTELDFGTVKKGYTSVAPQMLVLRNLSKSDIQLFDKYTYGFTDIKNPSIVFYDQEGPYNISDEETVLKTIDGMFEFWGDPRWEQAFKFTISPKTGLEPGEYNLDGNIQWQAKNGGGAGSSEWFTIKFKVEDGDPDPAQPDDGEKRVVQMHTAGIEKLNTIYYGRKLTNLYYDDPVPSWYVVDNQKDILGDLGGMYLLAKTLYGKEDGHFIQYDIGIYDLLSASNDYGSKRWQAGLVRNCIDVLWHSNFSEVEKAAVRNIEKTEAEIDESTEEGQFIYVANTVNDKLFPLSMNEVLDLPNELTAGFYKGEKQGWWLRSIEKTPHWGKPKNNDFYILDYFSPDGGIVITIVFKTDEGKKKFEKDNNDYNAKSSAPQRASAPAKAGENTTPTGYLYLPWVYGNEDFFYTASERYSRHGVRPAMNIDKNRVFMSSAAVGGKESGPLGSRALRKVRKSNPTEWKLTLIDTLRTGFTVAVDGYTPATSNSINVNHRVINSGAVMTIHYSGAPTGPNEFVSVALKRSSDNEVLYYGTIAANRASGDVTIPIPNDLEADQLHEVLIFSEQKNGDYYTDYVSPAVVYYIQMEKTEVQLYDDDYPFEEGDDPWNAIVINRNKGFETKYVKIIDRTLCRDGRWNTICLPFNLEDGNPDDGISFTGTLLEGAMVKQLVSSDYTPATSTLTLNFETVEAIEAGKPYIVRWSSDANLADVTSPVFNGVTISDVAASTTETEYTDFIGLYSSIYIGGLDRTMIYLGDDNKLYHPNDEMYINAFRGYFRLKEGLCASNIPGTTDVKTFVVNLGDEITAIDHIPQTSENADGQWYTIDGRRLQGKPTKKGIYIYNGKKVIK